MKKSVVVWISIPVVVVILFVLFGLLTNQPAHALSAPLSSLTDWQVTCATAATSMSPSGNGGVAFTCYSATPATSVFIGGSDVDTTGYCKSNVAGTCSTTDISIDARTSAAYCRVASGTVVLNCLAGRQ